LQVSEDNELLRGCIRHSPYWSHTSSPVVPDSSRERPGKTSEIKESAWTIHLTGNMVCLHCSQQYANECYPFVYKTCINTKALRIYPWQVCRKPVLKWPDFYFNSFYQILFKLADNVLGHNIYGCIMPGMAVFYWWTHLVYIITNSRYLQHSIII